jgi:acetyl esterase/lipase
MSVHFLEQLYPRQDAADEVSCRPDFAVAIYPGHLALWPPSLNLNPDIAKRVRRDMPPTFLLQNEDDDVDNVDDALSYYIGLRNAQVSVEMHLYPHGGHAFGLRPTEKSVTA